MPPVPNVIFASPRRTQPCPTSEACWSPTSAVMGGAPGSACASPDESGRVDDRRASSRSARRACRARPCPTPDASRVMQPGDRRVRRVGHVHASRPRASTRPRCRPCRSRVRRRGRGRRAVEQPQDLGRRLVGADSDAVGAEREALPDGAEILPAEAGADRFAACRGPTRRSSRAGWRCRPRRPVRRRRARRARARDMSSRAASRRTRRARRRGSRGAAHARDPRRRIRRRARPRRGRCSFRRRRRERVRSTWSWPVDRAEWRSRARACRG